MNPHRTPDPAPCEACERRKNALESFEAYVPSTQAGYYTCPACGQRAGRIAWRFVCDGVEQVLLIKRGFWFFGWRRRKVFVCTTEGADHFHMTCSACGSGWRMLTKYESEEVEDDEGETIEPESRAVAS